MATQRIIYPRATFRAATDWKNLSLDACKDARLGCTHQAESGMVLSPIGITVRFGVFELDLRTRQLTRNGMRIRLAQQPIQVLSLLLDRPGQIVTREELRQQLWPSDVFVDFDHGLNKSIQKVRDALGDSAASPRYIETIPRVGYRFIAPVTQSRQTPEPESANPPMVSPQQLSIPDSSTALVAERRRPQWSLRAVSIGGLGIVVVLALGSILYHRSRHRAPKLVYTQLTDFTDSAVAPALSPDGRMVAFIRGSHGFLTTDQIYVKMLPNGEARRVTEDDRPKYGLAFSPDGSQIAYTVLERSGFSTYEASVLGGEPHLLLENAAGLVWLDVTRLLFSEIPPGHGIHMGVVTATPERSALHEVYFPAHERGMAHYSSPSPDRRWDLVVEMDGSGEWARCRLIALEGQNPSRLVGPPGACTSAAWSPDGSWMYFAAAVDGRSHLWRQHFPQGEPEQITFGPTDEDGVAVEPDGRALITSIGVHQSAIWIHDKSGDRPLSSEGEVVGEPTPPAFSPDASVLYYLLRRGESSGAELWRTFVESGKSEAVFSGVPMTAFDLSPDDKQVVYISSRADGTTQLWVAPVNRRLPAIQVAVSGARSPRFGARGQILFEKTEGNMNYLEQIDPDGSHQSKVFPFPIVEFQGISPSRRWVTGTMPKEPEANLPAVTVLPLDGGPPRRICAGYCRPKWSTDGKFLFVQVEEQSRSGPGRSLAIPLGPAESLPDLPPNGIPPLASPGVILGTESIDRAELIPGKNPRQYAWVNTTVHRNLYRISLP
jgi:DNA-binding winged helix-turn-helix (wHTH) protein/Tol biopolymer transport system component